MQINAPLWIALYFRGPHPEYTIVKWALIERSLNLMMVLAFVVIQAAFQQHSCNGTRLLNGNFRVTTSDDGTVEQRAIGKNDMLSQFMNR
jgi:hypothetical protein